VRSYKDETRKLLLDGIKRVAEGEAIVAGFPPELKPEINVVNSVRSTYNDPDFAQKEMAAFQAHFGAARVKSIPASMGAEDFGEYGRADRQNIKSLIFWVGGYPADVIAKAKAEGKSVPSQHSPFFAPEADKVISTAAEALTLAAMRQMPKR
jgi:hippurate hydrolase